ncbi:MAG: CRISPR system precrRNA processing endoribonuclease RAMP protein Cas6 [Desulfurococcales archaeon]|nr:CRISPR system precrRNA processing endoribonuclease RAMP protein Cas6 [Desulfurococcales archaeon]
MARLLSKTLSGPGYLAKFIFRIEPIGGDVILPPFTGRTTKAIASKMECLGTIWKLYQSRTKFKPVTFKVLKDSLGRPVYKRGDGGKPLILGRSRPLYMEVAAYSLKPLLPTCNQGEVDIGYGRILVSPIEASLIRLDALGTENYDTVTIRIMTPMTISSKIMMPPVPIDSRIGKHLYRAQEMYRLLPTPGYLLAQALRQWLGIVNDIREDTILHYYLGRIADILIAETDYKLKPETALYGKDENDRELKIRGVTGYIRLAVLDQGIKWAASRLLGLAEYLGLGKSRSIGFGEIKITLE